MITIQMDKTTPVKQDHNTGVYICIVIMFHWCCFVHMFHWCLVQHQWNKITIQMDKTTPVKHDHNTGVQNNTSERWSQYRWTKQHQWNMITIQMDKTPVKHDYNTDGKINNGETWSQYRWTRQHHRCQPLRFFRKHREIDKNVLCSLTTQEMDRSFSTIDSPENL
jgi:hypothetical protein